MLRFNVVFRRVQKVTNIERTFNISSISNKPHRINKVNIQMINDKFHKVLFGENNVANTELTDIYSSFEKFNIDLSKTTINDTVEFELPSMFGENVESHLKESAEYLNAPYMSLLKGIDKWLIPDMPKTWVFEEGWTKYDTKYNTHIKIKVPDEDLLIFDIETLPKFTQRAIMAVALGRNHWYSWTNKCLIEKETLNDSTLCKNDLIPIYPNLDKTKAKCIIGHFVSFDRARIQDEYEIKGTGARFIDTMSMHIAIGGMTSLQRCLKISYNKNKTDNKIWKLHFMHNSNKFGEMNQGIEDIAETDKWITEASLNSLVDIYKMYFPKCDLSSHKDKRETFIKGNIDDVINDFQALMTYCGIDVLMTAKIFKKMWSEYINRFPHPASFTGILEMGSLYLPVNKNFQTYINKSSSSYNSIVKQEKNILIELALKALVYQKNKEYINDPWLWDLDWRLTKSSVPYWYKELMTKSSNSETLVDKNPNLITSQMRIAVKLLQLKWDGLPLHYDKKLKWGVLIPGRYVSQCNDPKYMDSENHILPIIPINKTSAGKIETLNFPIQKYLDFWAPMFISRLDKMLEYLRNKVLKSYSYKVIISNAIGIVDMLCLSSSNKMEIQSRLQEIEKIVIEKCHGIIYKCVSDNQLNMYDFQMNELKCLITSCKSSNTIDPDMPFFWFLQLPHENGEGNFVGSPLSKSFLNHIQSGRLTSHNHNNLLELMIEGKKSGVFWRNYQNRIQSQLVIQTVNNESEFAIIPQVIATGTVTRRSVEKLWLTATNATAERIGSELKAMIQPPADWVLVGADVDSQEQWIAAVLGDSVIGIHGGTPFGWMVLQGSKIDGTDLHSKTSKMIGISRDAAKVLNYSRMYGAGIKSSTDTLLKFNPELDRTEALSKIKSLMLQTKGIKTDDGWVDGIESEVFSKLEKIAKTAFPKTPILNAMLSKSLEKRAVNDKFMTSKCNWVVQSSGVDYLHCLLTFTKQLIQQCNINARLCICIHDEIRYLCQEKDKYRLALILQIANLYTRSVFSMKLNLNDLPQSVAFFSEVDIDYCLRKNPLDDCKTRSNPEGLLENYNIRKGESLNIYQILEKTGGKLMD